MHDPEGAHGFYHQVVKLVGVGAAANPGDGFGAIYGAAGGVLLNEAVVASFLNAGGDLVQGIVPGNVFPLRAARAAHLRLEQAAVVQNVLCERGALGAQRAAIGGMVRVAFDVNYLSGRVFGLVAKRVDDCAAAYRAVGASGARLTGARNLELGHLGVGGFYVEAEDSRCRAAYCGNLKEVSAIRLHCWASPYVENALRAAKTKPDTTLDAVEGNLESAILRGFTAGLTVNSRNFGSVFAAGPDTGTLCFLCFAVSTPFFEEHLLVDVRLAGNCWTNSGRSRKRRARKLED